VWLDDVRELDDECEAETGEDQQRLEPDVGSGP